jgi:hypothetical protein
METAREGNLGFEMGFFKNKVTLNVDLYDEHRSDILQTRKVSTLMGWCDIHFRKQW